MILTDGTAERGDLVDAIVTQTSAHELVASLDPEVAEDAPTDG